MEKETGKLTDDALQRRLARFIAQVRGPRCIGGSAGTWIGTNLGAIRQDNEDRALVTFASYKSAPQRNFALGALCDGIGGLARGGDAAVLAISVFVTRFLRTPKLSSPDRLRGAVMAANTAVCTMLGGRGGTTLSAVLIDGQGDAFGVNVGDSRIYGISGSRQLIRLSRDDTFAEMLGRHNGVKDRNQLLQFLGMGEGIEPHIVTVNPTECSTFLVTSDGIHGAPEEALAQVVRNAREDIEVVRRLIDLSDALGGHDNGTALILPTRVETSGPDHDQGLNLRFWSASDRLEIWIPVLADELRQDQLSAGLAEPGQTDGGEQAEKRGEPQSDLIGRGGRRSSKKKKSRNGRQLPPDKPEQPPLDIHFPGKNGY